MIARAAFPGENPEMNSPPRGNYTGRRCFWADLEDARRDGRTRTEMLRKPYRMAELSGAALSERGSGTLCRACSGALKTIGTRRALPSF